MADGLGNALVGLMGVAVTADVAGKVMKGMNKNVPKGKKMKMKKEKMPYYLKKNPKHPFHRKKKKAVKFL